MDAAQFVETIKTMNKVHKLIVKANAPDEVIESYLAALQYTLDQMNVYMGKQAERLLAERKASA